MSALACCYEMGCNNCASKSERAFNGKSKSKCRNFLCSPFALVGHSMKAYFFTCVWVYVMRFLTHVLCFACIHLGMFKCCFSYSDGKFKADDVALGKNGSETGIVWKRATEVIKRPVLFQQDVHPSDVVQGDLNNCWLMSAFACMAEFPALADKVFINREFSYRGKYQVALFNAYLKRWEVVTVDDRFPFKEKKTLKPKAEAAAAAPKAKDTEEKQEGDEAKQEEPKDLEAQPPAQEAVEEATEVDWAFAKPEGQELWVPVLEKAFAKLRGSYESLSGGNMLWAFQCLTGDIVFRMQKIKEGDRKGVWVRHVLAEDVKPDDIGPIKVKETNYTLRHTDFFDVLRQYDRTKALMGASISATGEGKTEGVNEERDEDTGLIRGHAYSLIAAKRVGTDKVFELVQLRNPWGKYEWKGDWSDDSQQWKDYPEIAQKLNHTVDSSDGTFWMEYNDFTSIFDAVDICDRTVNFADFHLDVHENPDSCVKHCFGPTQGCVEGCFGFWCKCRGIRNIYCGNKPENILKKAKDKKGRDDDMMANLGM